MNARTLFTAGSLLAAAMVVAPAQAATSIGTFKQWGAYTSSDSNGKMCFVASQPQSSKYQPDNVKVVVEIDGKTQFVMFTDKDSAWIENPSQESDLIAAMKGGSRMIVTGKSRRGTLTTDTYSLSGVTAALDAMSKECP